MSRLFRSYRMHPAASAARRPAPIARMGWVLVWALLALLWSPLAAAHAALVASDPPTHAVLQAAPAEIRLDFDEPVAPLVFRLAQPDGTVTPLEQARAEGSRIHLALPALSQTGTYALSWRVISTDGHPVGGSQLFSIGTTSDPAAVAQTNPLRNGLIWFLRLAWFVGLFAGVGMAAFRTLCHKATPAPTRAERWLLATGAAGALASLGLLGVDALDLPLGGLLGAAAWQAALATSFALAVLFSWLALGLAALTQRMAAGKGQRLVAMAAVAGLGLALSASGHASTAPPTWLARPTVWLHGLAVTAWIGALLPLNRALGRQPDLTALARFSRAIPVVLLVLVTSGATLIYLQFNHPASLWQTAYGQVLAAKLLIVACLLALGAYNRFALTDRVLASDPSARRALRRSIRLECLLAVAVLAVVSLWRFTPPPRAIDLAQSASPAATRVTVHLHSAQAMVQAVLEQAPGTSHKTMTLHLSNPDATPLSAQEVAVAFSSTTAGLEPFRYTAHPAENEDGVWQIADIQLPSLPHWDLEVEILISDFDRIRLRTQLDSLP